MAYTQEEWDWIRSRLTEGSRFLYGIESWATVHLGASKYGNIADRIHASFDIQSWDQNWPEYGMNIGYFNITDAKWPDGSPMIPFVEYDGKPFNPVLAKIASLDTRFKAKSLPKTTQKSLPLPA